MNLIGKGYQVIILSYSSTTSSHHSIHDQRSYRHFILLIPMSFSNKVVREIQLGRKSNIDLTTSSKYFWDYHQQKKSLQKTVYQILDLPYQLPIQKSI